MNMCEHCCGFENFDLMRISLLVAERFLGTLAMGLCERGGERELSLVLLNQKL